MTARPRRPKNYDRPGRAPQQAATSDLRAGAREIKSGQRRPVDGMDLDYGVPMDELRDIL